MADVLNSQQEVTLSFPILSKETTADGDLLVYGRVTDGTVDSDEQIVDPEWSAGALKNWLSSGANLRVQHQAMRDPAGVGLEIEIDRDGDKAHWLKALVVEPVAKRLVEKGALRAFSVGIMRPKVLTHAKARGGMIAGGDLGEVSLVDRPANRNCAFSLVKAAKDGAAEWVGKMEGDDQVITKMLKPTPADMAKAISNGKNTVQPHPEQGKPPEGGYFSDPVSNRLAAAIAADRVIEKRTFSTEERQHDASTGAAMPHGGYPIENKEDLSNAIRAIGRAKNPGATRAHIRRRAASLGATDMIPDSWKFDDGTEDEITKAIGRGLMTVKEARIELGLEDPDITKDGTCPTCHGDGKIRGGSMNCPDCGDGKKAKPASKSDGSMNDDDGDDGDDGDDDDMPRKPRGKKSAAFKCSACSTSAPGNASFCPGCGAEFTSKAGADPAAGVMHKPGTARGPDPAAVREETPPTWEGEPKGGDEPHGHGTGILTTATGGPVGSGPSTSLPAKPGMTAGRTARKTEAPYSIMRAHDAFCPAFSFGDVLKEYPSLDSVMDALNVAEVKEAALKAVASGSLGLGESLLRVARGADDLAGADKAVVSDARAALHKSFTEMYPDTHLTPGMVCATDFTRPYIAEGHASGSAVPAGGSPAGPHPPAPRPPASFSRGLITAGHQETSPGKMAAAEIMETVHDEIAGIFPDLCPMTSKASGEPMPPKQDKRPQGTAKLVPDADNGSTGKKGKKKKGNGSMQAAAMQQHGFETAQKQEQFADILSKIDALRGEMGGHNESLKETAAGQLREAAALFEKSAHGTASAAEVAALREKIAETHGLIIGASQRERQDSSDAIALKSAAEKLENAASVLAAHQGMSVPLSVSSSPDLGMIQEQLRNLQSLVMSTAGAQKSGAGYDSNGPELGALRSQLGELQGMIMSAQLSQKGEHGGQNNAELASLSRQLGELQGMMASRLVQKSSGGKAKNRDGGSTSGGAEFASLSRQLGELQGMMASKLAQPGKTRDKSYRAGGDNSNSSNAELSALRGQLGELQGMLSGQLAQKAAGGGGSSQEMAELRGKLGELQGMLMSSQLAQKNGNSDGSGGAAASQELGALRGQLGELQGMISAQAALKANGSNDWDRGRSSGDRDAGDSRALSEAAGQLMKAASMLNEKPSFAAIQPVTQDSGADIVNQKLDLFKAQIDARFADYSSQLDKALKKAARNGNQDEGNAAWQNYREAAEQYAKGLAEIEIIKMQNTEQQRLYREQREREFEEQRYGRRDEKRKDVKALKQAAAQLTKAAAVLSARPEVPADVQSALGSKADIKDVSVLISQVSEMQDIVNKMASAPDPNEAPTRGILVAQQGAADAAKTAGGSAVPVERRSLVDEAADQNRDEKYKFLKSLTASGDPNVREQAQAMIRKMLLS